MAPQTRRKVSMRHDQFEMRKGGGIRHMKDESQVL